jgi:cbb3-type cytochrome oxidase subunit 1
MNTNSSVGSNVVSSGSDAKYNDFIVKAFIISAFVWGLASMSIGVLIAFQLVYPQLNITEYFSFGRLRPLHTNAAIFGFALSAIFRPGFAIQSGFHHGPRSDFQCNRRNRAH